MGGLVCAASVSVLIVHCGGDEDAPEPEPSLTATVQNSPPPTIAITTSASEGAVREVRGFVYPIGGACLPTSDRLMPNAPREYRSGIHEGVDFYTGFSCVDIPLDTPVLAAAAGTIIRSDTDYAEITPEELDELISRSQAQGFTDEAALDRFRGRQVWIDHGDGVVTRYCHLNGIAPGLDRGVPVEAGALVAYVGNSGTPEAITAPGTEIHLHFEIRVDASYLGKGLSAGEVRALYEAAFSLE